MRAKFGLKIIIFVTSVELKHVYSCEVWRSWLKLEPSC